MSTPCCVDQFLLKNSTANKALLTVHFLQCSSHCLLRPCVQQLLYFNLNKNLPTKLKKAFAAIVFVSVAAVQ